MNIETFDIALPHGITLSCRGCGPKGAPLLLFVHGFPEAAFVWDELMARFGATHRCIAPNLRGYERSSAPAEVEAYRAKYIVADLVALIEQLGAPLAALVAHDWGGAVAWALASQQPELLQRLVIVNSPHGGVFLRELKHNPAQQRASAYMNFLVRPDAAALLAADDYRRLWTFFDGPDGTPPWLDDAMRERYRAVWRHGLDGGLNYYRTSPLRPASDALAQLDFSPPTLAVPVPTLVIWADGDVALLPSLLDGLDAWVPQLRIVRVADASHWIVHERPALIAAEIARELGA